MTGGPRRIRGSQGREAFTTALVALGDYLPQPPSRPPAFTYALPDAAEPTRDGRRRADGPLSGPLTAAAADLRSGRISSVELVEQALLAVEKFDGELNAVAELLAESARRDASACDVDAAAGRWRGPLHGIPLTVKDVIDVAGVPTRAGSEAYLDVPTVDATAVARARSAGAVILAKVTTHEFALGVTSPQSRNPHDILRIPGGSSGGSAIAVSTGMGLGSIGTDTRASIRVPAALSGTVGFKPTFGSVPTAGVVPLSWTMDHVAPMASTVADAALLLDVLTAPDRPPVLDAAGAGVRGLRAACPRRRSPAPSGRSRRRCTRHYAGLRSSDASSPNAPVRPPRTSTPPTPPGW